MNNENEIGIYILSRDRPKFLYKTIKSILSQKFKNFNLYISDNSKNNNFLNDLEIKFNKYLNVIKQSGMLSGQDHFNKVLRLVKEDYFMIMHDDDTIEKDFLFIMEQHIRQNPNCIAYACNAKIINQNDNIIVNKFNRMPDSCEYQFLNHIDLAKKYFSLSEQVMPFPSYIFNNKFCRDFMLKRSYGKKYNDAGYLINLANKKNILWINKILFNYRVHDSNDTINENITDRKILINFVSRITGIKKSDDLMQDYRAVCWFLFLYKQKKKFNRKFLIPLFFIFKRLILILLFRPKKIIRSVRNRYYYLQR